MLEYQPKMNFSPYMDLYEKLIPKEHLLRRLNQMVDFSFVEEELINKYCLDNGRKAIPPVQMFKYLLLKAIYCLSDGDLIERCRYDMSFKYFLGIAPEEDVIHKSLLSKFRTQRLKDTNLLDMLLEKSIEIALEKGVLVSDTIYVDATHIQSKYHFQTKREALTELARDLRHTAYQIHSGIKERFPKKPEGKKTEETVTYCRTLIDIIKQDVVVSGMPTIKEKTNYLEEVLGDLEDFEATADPEAKVGHKTKETSFFGYKMHLAMSKERLVTAAVFTPGNTMDGYQMKELVRQSRKNGMKVRRVIGDAAYGNGKNLKYAKQEGEEGKKNPEKIDLISPLMVSETHESRPKEGFEYNKDAGMYVCPCGHMSIGKKQKKGIVTEEGKERSALITYLFNIENCKYCPQKEGCYKEGSKSKSYSVSIRESIYKEHVAYSKTERFEKEYKERYQIESKNSELKNRYGCARANGRGLFSLQLQGTAAIFISNMKRIMKLEDKK